MSKAVISSLCFLLLAAAPFRASAQINPTDAAVQEAVRRQADRITLRQRLEDASAAAARGDLVTSGKLYDSAWDLVTGIGTGIDAEREQTIAGLTQVRMELAKQAQHRGDYDEAQNEVNDVLRVNPHNAEAIAFSDNNKKLIEAQRGHRPSTEVTDQIPTIQSNRVAAATMVQDARVLYELGKLDEAEAKVKQAMKLDPTSQAANYYSSLIEQAKFHRSLEHRNIDADKKLVEIEQAWENPVKRESLPVPNQMARTNLVFTGKGRQAILSKLDHIRLNTFSSEGLPLNEVVRYLSEEVKKRDPEKRGINFLINANQETVSTTPVSAVAGGGFGGAPAFGGGPVGRAPVPGAPGGAPAIDPATGLPVAAPAGGGTEQQDVNSVTIMINPALEDIRLADVLDAIVTVANHPIKYSILDYAVVFSLKGPEDPDLHIRYFKVDPNTFYQGLQSVSGLDFGSLVSSSSGSGGTSGGSSGGSSSSGGGQNGQNGGTLTIPRVQVTSGTISGGGGGAGGGGGGGGAAGGGGSGGSGLEYVTATNSMALVQTAVINFFRTVGVELGPQAGKNVFWNDREGTLMVRATSQELDIVEAAIQTLDIAPPQVNIKAKFVEVTQNDAKALGFDWYVGNYLIGNGNVGAQAGSAPSFQGAPTTANPGGTFPGVLGPPNTTITPSASDQLLTSGIRLGSSGTTVGTAPSIPAVATVTGILTDPQFRVVIRALEQRDGADLLNDSSVTTLSGRQTQIQVVDLQTIVTGNNVNQQVSNGGGGGTVGNGTVVSAPTQSIQPSTSVIPLGPTLDVIPYVSADGYTIQMTIIPALVEFLGYDNPGPFAVQAQNGNGTPLTAQVPLPHFRVRQVTTSAIVWDGQTVVLGGLISENIVKVKDQVPILGDLPFLGRFFRTEANVSSKKNLVIFVTPTIIDPAGNRVHTDEELPFAQSAIPQQKTVASSSNP
jgi:general secretion pathway protein D